MKEFIVKKTPHKPLIRNIEEYVSRVDTLDSDITSIRSSVDTLDSDITSIRSSVDTLDSDITSLDSRVDDTEKSISQLNDKLSNISVDMMTPIAYSELKSLRDNSKLTPGMFYRITDYECTTIQEGTRAMNNKFDIVVQALSSNTLSENAGADYHYTFVSGAISSSVIDGISPDVANIPAWELKYCLDNDTERFAWADDEQGKGVIYYMKDEWNNECPYDFKNIQFQRSAEWQEEHSEFITDLGLAVDDLRWFYTFSYINMENLTAEDLTLKQDLPSDEEGVKYGTHDNSMLPYTQDAISIPRIALNNNIMIYCPAEDIHFYGCYGNTFGNNCSSNTFGNGCYSNTFGITCSSNTFGNDCRSNTFGNDCFSNTFGNTCSSNTFGDDCRHNTFGNTCHYNTVGKNCFSNTFGNYQYSNTFGNRCLSNTFGNYCNYNTFGNDCNYNNFGNKCTYNIFGGSVDSLIAYARYIRFADGCTYVKLLNSESGNNTNCVQNITISAGVSGTDKSPLELQVSRNAPPVVYEAAGTTHITLD